MNLLRAEKETRTRGAQARLSLSTCVDNLNEIVGFEAFILQISQTAKHRPYSIYCLDKEEKVIGETTNLTRGQTETILTMVDQILTHASRDHLSYKRLIEAFEE